MTNRKKKIIVIDSIIEDRSIAQIEHIEAVMGGKVDAYDFGEIHVVSQEVDEAALRDCDAVIFSGSPYSVYEDLAWKKKMHSIFDIILTNGTPALAPCFGAQFLAYHLGAPVVKNPRGAEFGPVKIHLTEAGLSHDILEDYHQDKFVFATHEDIVESLPSGATLLAYNDNTPIQAYSYGNVLATQFHMDLPTTRTRKLLEARREKYLNAGVLRDEAHYEELMGRLHLGEQGHQILHRFLEGV